MSCMKDQNGGCIARAFTCVMMIWGCAALKRIDFGTVLRALSTLKSVHFMDYIYHSNQSFRIEHHLVRSILLELGSELATFSESEALLLGIWSS